MTDRDGTAPEADLVLDCRGLRCPLPVIRLAQSLTDVALGQTVEVVADDPAARSDVPAWCRMRGQELVGTVEGHGGDASHYLVRRVR